MERMPVSQDCRSNVESHTLEAMPVARRVDGLFRLVQTHTPGSSRWSLHFTTWAEIGLPTGVVVGCLFGGEK